MSTYGDPPAPDQPDRPGVPDQPAPDPFEPSFGATESVSFGIGNPGTVVPDAPRRRRRRRTAVIGGAAAAVLLVAGGVALAVSALSGGGAQPETVVPASAIAYARIDLDPSAGQKIAAYRFLRKFPSVDQTASDGDLLDQVVRTALKSDGEIDYDHDVKPWLGKRAGIAALPGTGDEQVDSLVVIQVKDEAKARTSLRKLLDEEANRNAIDDSYSDSSSGYGYCPAPDPVAIAPGDATASVCLDSSSGEVAAPTPAEPKPSGLVVRDGYALIGPDQATTQKLSDAASTASLADSATYKADMQRVGEPGVASAWVDLDAVQDRLPADAAGAFSPLAGPNGRAVAAIRFGGGDAELVAKSFGGRATTVGPPAGPMLAALPADVTGGFALGDTQAYAEQLSKIAESVWSDDADAGATFGLTLPDDLKSLLGTGLVVAVGDVSADPAQVAVRVRTTDPDASRLALAKVLTSLRDQADGFLDVPVVVDAPAADGLAYAVDHDYATTVAADGALGQDPAFQHAVPDVAEATSAGYVDFDRVSSLITDPEDRKDIDPLRSLGVTVRSGGGETEVHVRLVAG